MIQVCLSNDSLKDQRIFFLFFSLENDSWNFISSWEYVWFSEHLIWLFKNKHKINVEKNDFIYKIVDLQEANISNALIWSFASA